jgi:type VI secretion system protein VasJ
LLQGHHGLSVTKEDKFYWRLAKAELATQFGKNDIALALLEDLKEDIDRYHLDEWNPELAGRVFGLFLGLNRTQVNAEDIHAAYSRLCKINIEHALEIKL